MGFTEVADLDCNVTTAIGGVDKKSGKKNPTTITGFFIGSREVPSKKSKTGFAWLHVLQTEKGNVGVWGKTNLDQKMRAVKPGQLCKIDFVGMVETQNNPMYKYKVAVDPAKYIEVATADNNESAGAEATGAEQYESEGEPYAGTDQGEEGEEEESAPDEQPAARPSAPRNPARTPDATRQSRVQSLLNSTRKGA